jgi:ABC-2 type transport system permease protein
MKRMLTIFQFTLLKNVRDKGSLMQMLFMPVLLIFILGTALNPLFQHNEISPTSVGYLNDDTGPLSGYFDEFIRSDDLRQVLAVAPLASREEGLEKLQDGEIVALIHLDENFSSRVLSGEKTAIEVTSSPGNTLRLSIVENVLESFIQGANATEALQRMGAPDARYVHTGNVIEDLPVAASGIMPGAMDYYAVTMLVLFIMYGSMYSAFGMSESYLATIGQRIKGTPIRAAEHYIGLVSANIITVFIQSLIVVAFTKFVYGVNWGANLPMVLLIAFILVVVSIGLGAMIIMLIRNETHASVILNVIIPVFAFIAGAYFKFPIQGSIMPALQQFSPNYLAQTAIFNTIYDGPTSQTTLMLGGLVFLAIGTFAVAMVAERRAIR